MCSNHFVDGEPTRENPRPTLYLTASEMLQSTPRKRKYSERDGASELNNEEIDNEEINEATATTNMNTIISPSFKFEDLTGSYRIYKCGDLPDYLSSFDAKGI